MANHGCINGTLVDTKYSSPVPVIGLYIAAATLVCMFLMIYDIFVACHTRKRWLPCKMFKLDSITLTVISVTVKLTVDLTTPMPSRWDQLSKLCGTCMLCVYMGFIMFSVGEMKDSTNMYSLSILVITVIVNMCIQISTGVVVLFIPEHIIILCIMLILLGLLWVFAYDMDVLTRVSSETIQNFYRRSEETVLQRIKMCYLYGYSSNPQFVVSKSVNCYSVAAFILCCLAILIQAAFRSVIMKREKFCRGKSDYDWSMPIIVVTQILTVIVGSFVSVSRWFTMSVHNNYASELETKLREGEPYESNPILKNTCQHNWRQCLTYILRLIDAPLMFILSFVSLPLFFIYEVREVGQLRRFEESSNIASIEEFKYLIQNELGIDTWTLWKGWTEMENEIKVMSKSDQPNELFQLFSKVTPSQQLLIEVGHNEESSIVVSTLSMVVLVRIVEVSLPKDLNRSVVQTFRYVYAILCFIERNVASTSAEFAKKFEVAKAVWLAKDFSRLVAKTFDRYATGQGQSRSPTECALEIIAEVKRKMPRDMIYKEIRSIENFIKCRQYSSIKELYDFIEQLYVDMLHVILPNFPTATFVALTENPGDDNYHDRVRLVLKFFCQIEPLEAQIRWKFPQGCNQLGLITAHQSTPVLPTAEECNAIVSTHGGLHATEETVTVPSMIIHDAIIEVGDTNVATVS